MGFHPPARLIEVEMKKCPCGNSYLPPDEFICFECEIIYQKVKEKLDELLRKVREERDKEDATQTDE